MSRKFGESVWALYNVAGTEFRNVPSLVKQRAFVHSLDTEHASDVLKKLNDKEDNWDFKGMVGAKEVATSAIRGKLQEL